MLRDKQLQREKSVPGASMFSGEKLDLSRSNFFSFLLRKKDGAVENALDLKSGISWDSNDVEQCTQRNYSKFVLS